MDRRPCRPTPAHHPSGNVHGMPWPCSWTWQNPERKNDPVIYTMDQWDRLKKIGDDGAKLLPRTWSSSGWRDYEAEERLLIEQHGIRVITVEELRGKGRRPWWPRPWPT